MTTPDQSTPTSLHLRVFLASPGDVAGERTLALQVLERLPYDPLLRGRLTIEAVAWDQPGAGTPMLATMTPQAAIAAGLPKPSECDIVVVFLWSRMGTLLPIDAYCKPDIPRLRDNTIEGAKDWLLPQQLPVAPSLRKQWTGLRFTPGELGGNPFQPLAARLAPLLPDELLNPHKIAESLAARPEEALADFIGQALERLPD